MAITRLPQIEAGRRPAFESFKSLPSHTAGALGTWLYSPGFPMGGESHIPAVGPAGEALVSHPGQVPFQNPPSGMNAYLTGFALSANNAGGATFLCDRLWHNGGVVRETVTEQAIDSVIFPPRDRNGAVDGEGVLIGLEVPFFVCLASLTLAAPFPTIRYTNSQGVPNRVGTLFSMAINAPTPGTMVGAFGVFALDLGDTGVQSIQGLTLANSGFVTVTGSPVASTSIHLVAYRVLAMLPGRGATAQRAKESMDPMALCMPRLYDNTVPFFIRLAAVSVGQAYGTIQTAQG